MYDHCYDIFAIMKIMMSSCPQNFSINKQVGHVQEVEILPGVKRQMKTLSMRPLVFGKLERE